MYFSKHNIFSKLKNSDNYFIINILTGNADIISPAMAGEIKAGNYSDTEELILKGYLADEAKEKQLYNSKYLDFIDSREKDEIQIFFVPWYSCNFGCTYCYQSGYENQGTMLTAEVMDSFFRYIKQEFSGRKKYVTVFGGEPLLPGKVTEELVLHFLSKAKEAGIDTAFVTNGYTLEKYVSILKDYNIREIQVTLDGVEDIHNKRRSLKNGSATFDKIVAGIDAALAENININLRVVLDKDNMEFLPELAGFAVKRGWTNSPCFKTQLGRNYELHYCQAEENKLFTRVEFYAAVYDLLLKYPEIAEFHKPAFSISRFLFDNGKLPEPLFDACTGCKTEWAFDYTGNIYSCTATVGKKGESLGTFFPEITRLPDAIRLWEERDVTSIPECKSCSLQLACGGGCASIAYNRTGKLHSPDCRPIKELLEMGISFYFEKENI
ncbi:MAG: radical SAM protein [Ignavibacteriales bacterium]